MAKKKQQNIVTPAGTNSSKELEKRQLTDEEKARLDNYRQRLRRKPPRFKSDKTKTGNASISEANPEDPLKDVKLTDALGTQDRALQQYFLASELQWRGLKRENQFRGGDNLRKQCIGHSQWDTAQGRD